MTQRPDDPTQPIPTDATSEQPAVGAASPCGCRAAGAADVPRGRTPPTRVTARHPPGRCRSPRWRRPPPTARRLPPVGGGGRPSSPGARGSAVAAGSRSSPSSSGWGWARSVGGRHWAVTHDDGTGTTADGNGRFDPDGDGDGLRPARWARWAAARRASCRTASARRPAARRRRRHGPAARRHGRRTARPRPPERRARPPDRCQVGRRSHTRGMTDTTGQGASPGGFRHSEIGVGGDAQTERLTMLLDLQAAQPAVIRLRDWAFERLAPAPGRRGRRRLGHGGQHGASPRRRPRRLGHRGRAEPGPARGRRTASARPRLTRRVRRRHGRRTSAGGHLGRRPRLRARAAARRRPGCRGARVRACAPPRWPGGAARLGLGDRHHAPRRPGRASSATARSSSTQWPNPFSGRLPSAVSCSPRDWRSTPTRVERPGATRRVAARGRDARDVRPGRGRGRGREPGSSTAGRRVSAARRGEAVRVGDHVRRHRTPTPLTHRPRGAGRCATRATASGHYVGCDEPPGGRLPGGSSHPRAGGRSGGLEPGLEGRPARRPAGWGACHRTWRTTPR